MVNEMRQALFPDLQRSGEYAGVREGRACKTRGAGFLFGNTDSNQIGTIMTANAGKALLMRPGNNLFPFWRRLPARLSILI